MISSLSKQGMDQKTITSRKRRWCGTGNNCILEKMHSLVFLMLLLLDLEWAFLHEEHSSRVRCCMLYSTPKYIIRPQENNSTVSIIFLLSCHFGGPSSIISYCALLNAVITGFPSIKTTLSHPVMLKCPYQTPASLKITAESIDTVGYNVVF